MRQKIWGLFSIILIVSNMLPIGVFAEKTTQKGAVIQEALLKHSDGTEITNENPLSSGESIDVEMTWLISGEEALPAALPSNLIFEDQEGSMKDSKGTYVVKNNQLIFSKTDEEGPVVATVTLKASTTGKDLVNERVDFGNSVTKMIFYLPEEEDSDEPASQKSITPQAIKEIKPTVTNVLLEKSNGSGEWSPIEVGETQLTTKGFRLSVNWEIPDSSAIQAGDYMEIKLPSILRLTDVPASALNIKVEGQDYHVGTYELYTVTDASGKYDYSVFRVDFNDTIEREKITTIENGYFRYTGLFNKELTEEEIVTIGDFELPSFNIGKNPDREINFTENLYKQGYQSTNTNRLQWSVHVNMDDVTSIYKGGKASSETYSNAVFVDELDEGLTFLRQQVGSEAAPFPYRALVPIYKVLADGTVTDSRIGSVLMAHKDYHDVTTSIDMTSIDRAKEDIKNHPTGSFAIYTDDVTKKETLLIHLGEITDTAPGAEAGLVFDRTWDYMENMINRATSMTDEEKAATLASLKNLYDESNGTWSVGYTIEMQAEANSSISSDHKFSNTAHLYYDNGDMTSNESSVVYQKSDAGGEGKVPKNAIEIVKRDKDTTQPIADVEFEVVSFDNDQEGVQVGTLTTDPNGKATLGNLKVGKYKIKEVSGLDNYDPKMIIENQTNLTTDGVFEISASDTAGFSFEIYNQRLSGSVDIKVKKILNGSALKAGDFEFTLTGHGENQTQTNAENGAVAFDNIKYDTPGIYTYTIEETKGNAEGITYDPKKVTATVTVKKGQGELETSVVYTDDDEDNSNTPEEFINTYVKPKPKPTELALEAKKTLEGKDLSADDFEFKLTGHGEDQTKKNAENGDVKFDSIDYDTAGTYVYTIEEIAGNATGITYDSKKVTATVNVKENSDNELEANVVYTDDDDDDTNTPEEFVNKYEKPKAKPTELALEAKKTLEGKDLSADDFEFKLTGHGENQTKTNTEKGNIKFDSIDYDKAGTYVYTIEEVAGNATGITYDSKKVTATVNVKENSDNELEANVVYTDDDNDDTNTPEEFVNSYVKPLAKPTELALSAKKTLNGKDLSSDDFEFKLTGHGENQTKTNTENGDIKFDGINYDTAGTYVYTIEEIAGNATGITYDSKKVTATVNVKENSDNELEANVVYTDDDNDDTNTPEEFVNSYVKPKAKPTELALEAKKTLEGKDLSADDFEFKLTGHGEDQTKTNTEKGNIKFDSIDYDTAGTYVYTIEEIAGNATGITYDSKKVTATVTVEENSDNELDANVVYTDDDGDDTNTPEEFVNTYVKPLAKPTELALSARKTLIGKDLSAGDFEFKLTGHGEDQTKKNAENGDVKFDSIDYDTAGTYVYTIEEIAGNATGITYDSKKITATVTVEENNDNELKASVVYTDDDNDDTNISEEFINKYAEQKKENGKITIVKIDGDSNDTLEGAEFEVRDAENKVVKIDGKTTAVTGKNGKLTISDLAPGKYTLTEVKAPQGYELDATPINFEIKADGNSDVENDQKEVKNHQKKNGVTLKKVDNKDHTKTLKDAEFELQDAAGKVLAGYEKLVTDENGLIHLDKLPKGEYQFVETKAPAGYKLDSTPVKFSIENNNRIDVVKENTLLKTEKGELPNTGKNNGNSGSVTQTTAISKLLPNTGDQQNPFAWIGLLCLLFAGIVYYSQRKRRKNRVN